MTDDRGHSEKPLIIIVWTDNNSEYLSVPLAVTSGCFFVFFLFFIFGITKITNYILWYLSKRWKNEKTDWGGVQKGQVRKKKKEKREIKEYCLPHLNAQVEGHGPWMGLPMDTHWIIYLLSYFFPYLWAMRQLYAERTCVSFIKRLHILNSFQSVFFCLFPFIRMSF